VEKIMSIECLIASTIINYEFASEIGVTNKMIPVNEGGLSNSVTKDT